MPVKTQSSDQSKIPDNYYHYLHDYQFSRLCHSLFFNQLTFHSMLELAHAQGLTNDHVFFQFIAWQKDKINLSFVIVGMGVLSSQHLSGY